MRGLLCVASLALGMTLAGAASGQTFDVSFDIKPTSCPNPFNPAGSVDITETVPTAILGTEEFDPPSQLNTGSLRIVVPSGGGLRGDTYVYPTQIGAEDVATPAEDTSRCQCTEDGPDGFQDLKLQFDADDIAAALGSVWGGQRIHICVEGELLDGRPIRGCDCIIIVGPVSVEAESWGRMKATYR